MGKSKRGLGLCLPTHTYPRGPLKTTPSLPHTPTHLHTQSLDNLKLKGLWNQIPMGDPHNGILYAVEPFEWGMVRIKHEELSLPMTQAEAQRLYFHSSNGTFLMAWVLFDGAIGVNWCNSVVNAIISWDTGIKGNCQYLIQYIKLYLNQYYLSRVKF